MCPILLPEIHLTNLGQGPNGITVADLTEKVLGEVTVAAIKAAQKAVADLGRGFTDAAKELGKGGGSNTVDKISKGVGNLFKKK